MLAVGVEADERVGAVACGAAALADGATEEIAVGSLFGVGLSRWLYRPIDHLVARREEPVKF